MTQQVHLKPSTAVWEQSKQNVSMIHSPNGSPSICISDVAFNQIKIEYKSPAACFQVMTRQALGYGGKGCMKWLATSQDKKRKKRNDWQLNQKEKEKERKGTKGVPKQLCVGSCGCQRWPWAGSGRRAYTEACLQSRWNYSVLLGINSTQSLNVSNHVWCSVMLHGVLCRSPRLLEEDIQQNAA